MSAGRMVRGEFRPWQPPAPGRYCLAICYCGGCEHYRPAYTPTAKPAQNSQTPRLLDKDTWRVRFIDYIRALPAGVEFTTADLHDKIPDPPHFNHWGAAQKHAARLGLIEPVAVQESSLETTKASLVRRWRRVAEAVAA